MATLHTILSDVRENAITHGSLPFWSWNDKLEENELRRQVRRMHDLKMNGFFMHARGGLETEYLSDDWFNAVNVCVDEAKKLGMEAWSYDENGWPSGFAGGKLLEDKKNHATFVTYKTEEAFPTDAAVLGVYTLDGTKLTRVKAPVAGCTCYHVVRQDWDPTYVDTLDAEITEKFLEATHAEYKKRVAKEDFGTAMPGFFTDEPQYYRYKNVWSDKMPTEFYNAYGYDVLDYLPALFISFDGDKEFRFDYWKLCHHLFIHHWIKPVYDFCQANGCKVTGHAVEETVLHGQMWCCGGVMPFYQYEDIPGMDYLGRGLTDDVAPKQIGSACAQLGRKKVLSEMFACCGWDVTPKELKKIAELQYAGGVNMMCQHLYAYSIRGQRKRDYPANYSEHLPWQTQMAQFDEYYNNLGYMLAEGEEAVNTLVIHPIHAAYLTYQREADYASIQPLEDKFHALSKLLSGNQIPYHWGDESMMADMAHVDGNTFVVGKCSYRYVIIPSMETLDKTTVALLKAFLANGGKVWCFGNHTENGVLPTRTEGRIADMTWLSENVSFEEIAAAADAVVTADNKPAFRQMVRNTKDGKRIFIVNLTENTYRDVQIAVAGVKGLVEIDLATLTPKPVRGKTVDGKFVVYADFEDAQSHLYIESEELAPVCPCAEKPAQTAIRLTNPITFAEMPENELTLDRFSVSFDGGRTFTEERPLERIRDNLLKERFNGDMQMKATFTVDALPSDLTLVVEPLAGAAYTVNGQPVTADGDFWLDRSFRTVDILPFVRVGTNEITVSLHYWQRDYVYYVLYGGVSETLRNCLVFDTEIECLYLKGHFALKTDGVFTDDARHSIVYTDGGFALTAQKPETDPSDVVRGGYPFFAGTMKFKTVCTYTKGGAAELYVRGRYAVGEIFVNGKQAATLLFTDHCDLSAFLREGDNEIVIALTNSNRNLLGPHHGQDPEPYGVGPGTFSMENAWNGGECGCYVNRYAFVKFGFEA